jgi:peptidyl-dipeptidase Dcp
MELMMSVWEPAVAQVHKDVASMQKIVDAEEEILKFLLGIIVIIRRKFEKKYDLDQNVVKEYLQLENLREGMFGLLVSCLICNSSRLLMFLYTMLT